MELSPEEKQIIYEEEKTRIEARDKIQKEKNKKRFITFIIIGLLLFSIVGIISSIVKFYQKESDPLCLSSLEGINRVSKIIELTSQMVEPDRKVWCSVIDDIRKSELYFSTARTFCKRKETLDLIKNTKEEIIQIQLQASYLCR